MDPVKPLLKGSYSSEREIDVHPAGHGGTGLAPTISSFISSPTLPPKGGEGVNPLHTFRVGGRVGELIKLEMVGAKPVPPCPAG